MGRYARSDGNPELSIGAAARLLAGVHPKIVAAEHGVSLRTAYRWRKGLRAIEVSTKSRAVAYPPGVRR